MAKIYLTFIATFFCLYAYSQKVNPKDRKESKIVDSLVSNIGKVSVLDNLCRGRMVSDNAFQKVKENDFTLITTPANNNSTISRVTVDVATPKLNIDGSIKNFKVLKSPARFLINAQAGTDGTLSNLFSDSKVKSNFKIGGRVHVLLSKMANYKYYYDDCISLKVRLDSLKTMQVIDSLNYLRKYKYLLEKRDSSLNEYTKLYKIFKIKDGALNKYREDYAKDSTSEQYWKVYYEMIESALLVNKVYSIYSSTNQDFIEHSEGLFDRTLPKKYRSEEEKMELEAKWSSKKLKWITFDANINAQGLYLFDRASANPNNQIIEKSFVGNSFGISYNYYYNYAGRSLTNLYMLLNVTRSFSNTFENPSEVSRAEKYVYQDTTITRTLKYTGYLLQDYKEEHYTDYNLQLIKFLNKQKSFALDLKFNYRKPDKSDLHEGITNVGLGIIFAAYGKDKEKPSFHVELITTFKDLFEKIDSSKEFKWYNRNRIDLRIGIPINPIK